MHDPGPDATSSRPSLWMELSAVAVSELMTEKANAKTMRLAKAARSRRAGSLVQRCRRLVIAPLIFVLPQAGTR